MWISVPVWCPAPRWGSHSDSNEIFDVNKKPFVQTKKTIVHLYVYTFLWAAWPVVSVGFMLYQSSVLSSFLHFGVKITAAHNCATSFVPWHSWKGWMNWCQSILCESLFLSTRALTFRRTTGISGETTDAGCLETVAIAVTPNFRLRLRLKQVHIDERNQWPPLPINQLPVMQATCRMCPRRRRSIYGSRFWKEILLLHAAENLSDPYPSLWNIDLFFWGWLITMHVLITDTERKITAIPASGKTRERGHG